MSFDINDPATWSLDDPVLWMHEEWYRKRNSLPDDAVIPGLPQPRKEAPKFAGRRVNRKAVVSAPSQLDNATIRLAGRRLNKLTVVSAPIQPDASTFRVAGKNVTPEELLHGLKNVKRSVSEEYYMKKNGDPLGDLEADWWEQYKEFFVDPGVDENDSFALWNAKQHHKMDLKCERKLTSQENLSSANSSGSTVQSQSAGSRLPVKVGVSGKKVNQKNEAIDLEELKMDLQEIRNILPVLKEKVSKLQRLCLSGKLEKNGNLLIKAKVEGVLTDVRMLNKVAHHNHVSK